MWLVNGRLDVTKPALLWNLWRLWGRWDWSSPPLPGHTQLPSGRQHLHPGDPRGGCSSPHLPARRGEGQTRKRQLRQLRWVLCAQQGWSRRRRQQCSLGPAATTRPVTCSPKSPLSHFHWGPCHRQLSYSRHLSSLQLGSASVSVVLTNLCW